jgi:hypothetical protein
VNEEAVEMNGTPRQWSPGELDLFGRAHELRLSTVRDDGSLRSFVTVWMVRVGADLYVRSGAGYGGVSAWFARARNAGSGIVRVEDQEWPARFAQLDPNAPEHSEIDAAYVRKYGGSFGMTDAATHEHTLRISLVEAPPVASSGAAGIVGWKG